MTWPGTSANRRAIGNVGAVVIDGTDAASGLNGDNLGPGGTNEGGWLYMQKVIQRIQPNVTNGEQDAGGMRGRPGRSDSRPVRPQPSSPHSAGAPCPAWGGTSSYLVGGESNIDAVSERAAAQRYRRDSSGNVVWATIEPGADRLTLYRTMASTLGRRPDRSEETGESSISMALDIARRIVDGGGGLYAEARASGGPARAVRPRSAGSRPTCRASRWSGRVAIHGGRPRDGKITADRPDGSSRR